jgi:2',3'-cyclic-nucleotide 2'-phosphodiesterase (5'-nucleotidase family)
MLFRFLIFFISVFSLSLQATTIQILHTNDLHSFLSGPTPALGGYYRIKTAMDQLKENAAKKGIQTLVLDGGDFGEGNYLFLYNRGISSLKAFSMLGVDAAVLGNHDYMFGGPSLREQIERSGIKTKILGANVAQTDDMRLKGILKADAVFNVNGKSVYVVGLTTSAPHYMYAIRPGVIFPEVPVSRAYTKIAKEDNHDLIIALTHIGLNKDETLVKKDPNIDLVIGGHSHTRLEEAVYVKNSKGLDIPIVQTGAHGMALGRIIMEIPDDGQPYIKEYELIDMNQYIARDPSVLAQVKEIEYEAQRELSQGRWREVLIESDIELGGYSKGVFDGGDYCWFDHIGKSIQTEADADVGLYLTNFMGEKIKAGEITYGDIIRNFPHINEFGQPGWEIMKIKMSGWQILSLLTGVVNVPLFKEKAIIGGVDYKTFTIPKVIPWIGGKTFFTRFRINGKRLKFKKKYDVALPFELKKLLEGILSKKLVGYLNLNAVRNEYYLWPMLEDYLSKQDKLECI